VGETCVKPALQATLHAPETQVAVPLVGVGQGVHDDPHEAGEVFETHALPQRCVPALQLTPQAPATQVAVPPAGAGQGEHDDPQVAGDASETQPAPQG
jgi:hypothetical protein